MKVLGWFLPALAFASFSLTAGELREATERPITFRVTCEDRAFGKQVEAIYSKAKEDASSLLGWKVTVKHPESSELDYISYSLAGEKAEIGRIEYKLRSKEKSEIIESDQLRQVSQDKIVAALTLAVPQQELKIHNVNLSLLSPSRKGTANNANPPRFFADVQAEHSLAGYELLIEAPHRAEAPEAGKSSVAVQNTLVGQIHELQKGNPSATLPTCGLYSKCSSGIFTAKFDAENFRDHVKALNDLIKLPSVSP